MAKRHHSGGSMKHHADKFNDERKHQQDSRDGHMMRMTGAEMYAGMEPRRRQELEDGGMIHENHMAIANLPQEVMIKPYPKVGPWMPEGLDDTLEGVDRQIDYDDSQRRAHFYPKKV
jgi:hypothetical protein